MGLFSCDDIQTLDDLLVHQLKDLYDAEHRQIDLLPEMAKAASCAELKQACDKHLGETRQQIKQLEDVFGMLSTDAERVTCDAMKGLVSEAESAMKMDGDCCVRDAALIAASQRIEHYEIAGYGCLRNFAKKVGRDDVAEKLQEILDEEYAADDQLTNVAVDHVNVSAATA